MQVNLRKYANIDEATILRWRGYRFPVEVEDDHGNKVLSDTFALMLTWQGLIAHRAYNHIPYSVEELIPSNKVNGVKSISYNDDVMAIPLNWLLETVMPDTDDPVEIDQLKRYIHIWQNKLNNLSVVMSERYAISATAESVAELMEDLGIMEIRDSILNNEVSTDDGEKIFADYIRTAETLDDNTMALMARTGGVTTNQAFQTTIIRGKVFDLNNTINPNAIKVPYAHGITKLGDALGERNSSGKAQPLTSRILTPTGWKLMGDMEVGDEVIAVDGTVCKVTAVTPQGITPVQRVHFRDGRYTDTHPKHEWRVYREKWCSHAKAKTLTPEQIENRRWRKIETQSLKRYLFTTRGKTYIELNTPHDNEPTLQSVDPYELGFGVTGRTVPIHTVVNKEGQRVKLGAVRLRDQFIPEIYLNGSLEQRVRLLQGLMDSKATVTRRRPAIFSTPSKQLAADVTYLIQSLGGIVKSRTAITNRTKQDGTVNTTTMYYLSIRHKELDTFFTVPEKLALIENGRYTDTLKLEIVRLEQRPDQPTQCITIDHPSHLYITDGFIVTSNSLINNGRSLKDAEWFHRKMHLLTAVISSVVYGYDCGTRVGVPVKVVNASMALMMMGKYQILEDGSTRLIHRKTLEHIRTGETVMVRSSAFCNSPDPSKPCSKCCGKISTVIPYNVIMSRSANMGMYSGTTLCNPMGQRMLSTKHFIRNATTKAFEPMQKDKNVIHSNGDQIFLQPELCTPGSQLILHSKITRDLSDLKSLDILDEVGLEKLPYFNEVTFRYQVEDIMVGGTTTQQHAAQTSVSSRNARFSLDFLRYILENGWDIVDKRFISVDLSNWKMNVPMFNLPYTREDLDVHRARVENFMTFNKRNTAWRKQVVTPKIFGEVWSEFWSLISQEITGINMTHIETLLYCCLARDPANNCYALANGTQDKYFVSFIKAINNRGAGGMLIFESQQALLNDPKTFEVTDKPGSVLECFWSGAVS